MNAYDLHNYGEKVEKILSNPKLLVRLDRDKSASQWTIDGFVNADPSPTYTYLEWIVKSYIDQGIKLYEDVISRVKPALNDYIYLISSNKLKIGDKPWENERNILNYCGLVGCKQKGFEKIGLETLLQKYNEDLESRREKQLETNEVISNSKTVFEDDEVKVIWPQTEKASCYYGQGTKWCTAATEADNMFNVYNKQGKLYIVIPKHPNYVGEKYQLHIETDSIMNEEDDSISIDELFENYPTLEQFKPFQIFLKHDELLNACTVGDADTVKELLEEGVSPRIRDYGCVANAVRKGHIDVIKILLNDDRFYDTREWGLLESAIPPVSIERYPKIKALLEDAIEKIKKRTA